MERLSIVWIQFINLHSCLNDLLTLNCLIIHYKIHKLIKIWKYFDDIWIECIKIRWLFLLCGFFFCIILLPCLRYMLLFSFLFTFLLSYLFLFIFGDRFYLPYHNFLKHFLIQIKLCILLFFVLIFTRQSFFKIIWSYTNYIEFFISNLLVFSLIIF